MTHPIRAMLLAAAALWAAPAGAQPVYLRVVPDPQVTGSVDRAPWQAPYEFDSGSDNDKHPSRPYYQQGRGQQTGGTARNLLPADGLTIAPR